ncbi:Predicted PurR-regulated permease PerM [Roseovarius tolerans]|uniref:Predicted PurR-regulated permease PerM n=1 Tax=Roseovarius tolerans TaxID=74031 RepID=A0A1H7YNX7_9RHOB|nr:AI-2E family transporter [Roseovarius tolerans]SEM47946.1 Predicted PurR-regulated permease PerM [Roseovarius tolerans]
MLSPHSTGDPIVRVAVIVIAVTLGFGTLKLGADIFAPMVLGVVTGVILAPMTDVFERWGLPAGLASAIMLVLGVSVIAVMGILVEPLIWRVVEHLPTIKWELRAIIGEFRGLVRGLDAVNREVEEALGTQSPSDGSEESGPDPMPTLTSTLFLAPVVLAQVLIFGGTLFFFLLTRKGIYQWLAHWIGTSRDTAIIQRRFATAERLVARYFLTISIVNAGLGIALGTALALIGMPAPIIWGMGAALLNFILYAGPMVVVGALLLAGLIVFDGLMILAPAAIFLMLNMIEAQFVTPSMVGRHISVNPLLIFVSLVIWLWIWGPIGGIVAIPVLVMVLVMLDIFEVDSEIGAETAMSQGTADDSA